MDFSDFTSTKEFQNLHPLKQQLIIELVQSSQNTPLEKMLPKIMSINQGLNKRNMSFTKEESQLLINILKENMTPDQRQKVDMLMKLLPR
jgi:hypothetical protein